MALIFPAPITPTRAENVREFLQSIASFDSLEILRETQASQLGVSDGLPVYTVTLDDILTEKPLSQAKLHLWRHLLILGQQALAEIDATDAAESSEVIALHTGQRAGAILKGIALAESLPQAGAHDLEVRFLQCAGIRFMALWLHGATPGADWLIPVEPDQTGLGLYQPVQEAEILPVIQPLAEKMTQWMAQPGSEHMGN